MDVRRNAGAGFPACASRYSARSRPRWRHAISAPSMPKSAGRTLTAQATASSGRIYRAARGAPRAGFVASEKNGVWGKAIDAGRTGRIASITLLRPTTRIRKSQDPARSTSGLNVALWLR
jgi:hypothetical protein